MTMVNSGLKGLKVGILYIPVILAKFPLSFCSIISKVDFVDLRVKKSF